MKNSKLEKKTPKNDKIEMLSSQLSTFSVVHKFRSGRRSHEPRLRRDRHPLETQLNTVAPRPPPPSLGCRNYAN